MTSVEVEELATKMNIAFEMYWGIGDASTVSTEYLSVGPRRHDKGIRDLLLDEITGIANNEEGMQGNNKNNSNNNNNHQQQQQ